MADAAVTWAEFEQADPALAQRVMTRLQSHRHAIMATVRADGSPRLSGMEAPIRSGHLWLAMTPGSHKAADLARDPRFSLHSALDAEDLQEGDARIEGAVLLADEAQQAEFVAQHRYPVEDPSIMVLFTTLIQRVVLVRVDNESLLIETWAPTKGHGTQRLQ